MRNLSSISNEAQTLSSPSFLDEVKSFYKFLPNKDIFIIITMAWMLLFHFLGNSTFGYVDTASLFVWMFNAYNAPASEDGHGNLIPFVVLALFWWKRKSLMQIKIEQWNLAILILVFSLLLHGIGFVAQQPRISIVAMFLGLYGIIGLCWGRAWMAQSFFPYFLFAFSVPIGSLATTITFPLRLLVSEIAVGIAAVLLQLDIIREGTLIFDADRSFQYDVAPACSGLRSLIALFALTTIYGFISFQSMWRRALMMFISLPLAVAGNVLRITIVIVVGDIYGSETGVKIEQNLGFVTFLVAMIGVMVLAHFLSENPVKKDKDA